MRTRVWALEQRNGRPDADTLNRLYELEMRLYRIDPSVEKPFDHSTSSTGVKHWARAGEYSHAIQILNQRVDELCKPKNDPVPKTEWEELVAENERLKTTIDEMSKRITTLRQLRRSNEFSHGEQIAELKAEISKLKAAND